MMITYMANCWCDNKRFGAVREGRRGLRLSFSSLREIYAPKPAPSRCCLEAKEMLSQTAYTAHKLSDYVSI